MNEKMRALRSLETDISDFDINMYALSRAENIIIVQETEEPISYSYLLIAIIYFICGFIVGHFLFPHLAGLVS